MHSLPLADRPRKSPRRLRATGVLRIEGDSILGCFRHAMGRNWIDFACHALAVRHTRFLTLANHFVKSSDEHPFDASVFYPTLEALVTISAHQDRAARKRLGIGKYLNSPRPELSPVEKWAEWFRQAHLTDPGKSDLELLGKRYPDPRLRESVKEPFDFVRFQGFGLYLTGRRKQDEPCCPDR